MIQTNIHALRYGESGIGKTAMLRTWPLNVEEGEWMAVFDFDGGANTIRNPVTGEFPPGIFVLTFRDTERKSQADPKKLQREARAFSEARQALEEIGMAAGREMFIPNYASGELEHPWQDFPKVIAVDTLSGLHDAAMNLALTLDPKTGLAGAPAMHHWGAQMRLVEEFLKMCEANDGHLDVTAHVQAWKDDVLGTSRGTILATGQKTPGLIPAWFDEVYYHTARTTDKGVKYVLRTRNDGYFVAKSRLGIMSGEIDITLPDDVLMGKASVNGFGWGRIFEILAETYGA